MLRARALFARAPLRLRSGMLRARAREYLTRAACSAVVNFRCSLPCVKAQSRSIPPLRQHYWTWIRDSHMSHTFIIH